MGHKPNPKHGQKQPHAEGKPSATNVSDTKTMVTDDKNKPPCCTDQKCCHCTAQPPKKWYSAEWLTAGSTIALALFAIISAILLWIQLCDSRETFTKDQRPYVWIHEPPLGAGVTIGMVGQKFGWNVWYANYGKSPALSVCEQAFIVVGPDADKKITDINYNVCGKETGAILAPTELNYGTAHYDVAPTGEEYGVYGRIDYKDASGNSYFSQFCMMHLASGAVSHCPNHDHFK